MADIQQVLQLLSATPTRLVELSEGVASADLQRRPAPEEWSAAEVLAHLRSCADVWGGCIERILTEDVPTIRAMNPRTYIEKTDYPSLPFEPSLQVFCEQRADLLSLLEGLSPQQWSRAATVTGAGRPLQRTVLGYAEWLATHERAHVKQVGRVVAAVTGRG